MITNEHESEILRYLLKEQMITVEEYLSFAPASFAHGLLKMIRARKAGYPPAHSLAADSPASPPVQAPAQKQRDQSAANKIEGRNTNSPAAELIRILKNLTEKRSIRWKMEKCFIYKVDKYTLRTDLGNGCHAAVKKSTDPMDKRSSIDIMIQIEEKYVTVGEPHREALLELFDSAYGSIGQDEDYKANKLLYEAITMLTKTYGCA
jgi:hypothetical protein